MPLINQAVLKSFLGRNHFISAAPDITEYDQVVKQVESKVFQNTLITIPEKVEDAIPMLQNIACVLFLWFASSTTDTIEMWQYQRLKKMYDDAMAELRDIRSGKTILYDKNRIKIETGFSKPYTFYVNNERSERL